MNIRLVRKIVFGLHGTKSYNTTIIFCGICEPLKCNIEDRLLGHLGYVNIHLFRC